MQRGAAPPRRPFRRDPEEKRARILAVARRLFSEQSYDATTMAEIAHLAGVAEGTVFHHFHSKPELLRAVVEDYACDLWEAMFASVLGERLSFGLSFERAYEFIRKEGLPAFQPGRDEPKRIVYEVLEARMLENGAELLEELARRGLVRRTNSPMVARWIFSIFITFLADSLELLDDKLIQLDDFIERVVELTGHARLIGRHAGRKITPLDCLQGL